MYCPKCGKELPDYAKFCPDCGTPRLSEEPRRTAPVTPAPTAHTPAGKVNSKILLAAAAVIVVLLVVLIVRVGRTGTSAEPAQAEAEQDPAAALVGTWTNKDGVGLKFTKGGTVTLSGFGLNLGGDTFSYEVIEENRLALTTTIKGLVSADIEAPYMILGDTLYIEISGYQFELTKK